MPTVLSLLVPLTSWWFLSAVLLALIICWSFFQYVVATPEDNEWINRWLREESFGKNYSKLVNDYLDWLDERLAPDSQFKKEAEAAWGWPLLAWTLRLAFAYSILFPMVTWIITGEEGQVGGLGVLSSDPPWWVRVATLGAIVSFVRGMLVGGKNLLSRKPLVFQLVAYGLGSLFVGVSVVGSLFADAVAVAGAFILIVVVVRVGAGAFPGAFAGAFAIIAAGGVIAADTVVAAIIVAGVTGSVGTYVIWHATEKGYGAVAYTALCILMLLGLTAVAVIVEPGNANAAAVLIFLGVVPVWNGVFDYLSVGLTRWLVRAGARRREKALLYGCYDLAAAGLAFTGLGCMLIAMVHLMNSLASEPLLDLSSLFNDLRTPARRDDYWWFYAMLFSTLVPTLLHLAVSLWSLTALIPARLKKWVVDQLPKVKKSGGTRWFVEGALTLMATTTVVMPLLLTVLIGSYLYNFHPEVGRGYLWLFERFAQLIGAGVVPGPV